MVGGFWGGIALIVAILAAIFGGLYFITGDLVAPMMLFFVVGSAFLILVILIQKPKGGGLSGAFGGGGGGGAGGQTAFGAKTGDVLTWVTVAAFVLFLGLAMGITWKVKYDVWSAKQQSRQMMKNKQLAPASQPVNAPAAQDDEDDADQTSEDQSDNEAEPDPELDLSGPDEVVTPPDEVVPVVPDEVEATGDNAGPAVEDEIIEEDLVPLPE